MNNVQIITATYVQVVTATYINLLSEFVLSGGGTVAAIQQILFAIAQNIFNRNSKLPLSLIETYKRRLS